MGFIIMYSSDSKEFVGCDKKQAIYKSRHRADLSRYILYDLNLGYDRRHHIHKHKNPKINKPEGRRADEN